MENYDCNQSAERVLMDASRKKNQNRNRLLFIVITITVGVIFSVFSLIYGKMEIDIQKNMKADGMAVSTYIENGTADMTQQLTQLPCIESIGKRHSDELHRPVRFCDALERRVCGGLPELCAAGLDGKVQRPHVPLGTARVEGILSGDESGLALRRPDFPRDGGGD